LYYSFSTRGDVYYQASPSLAYTEAEKRVKESPRLLNEPHYNPKKKNSEWRIYQRSFDYSKSEAKNDLQLDTTLEGTEEQREIDPARIKHSGIIISTTRSLPHLTLRKG